MSQDIKDAAGFTASALAEASADADVRATVPRSCAADTGAGAAACAYAADGDAGLPLSTAPLGSTRVRAAAGMDNGAAASETGGWDARSDAALDAVGCDVEVRGRAGPVPAQMWAG
jgi:hypothetical protein